MKMYSSSVLILCFLTFRVSACSWVMPTVESLNSSISEMIISENHKYLLKMIPSKWSKNEGVFVKKSDSVGTVLELSKNGDFHEKWSSKGIFPYEQEMPSSSSKSYDVFISNDGKRVVKIKNYIGPLYNPDKAVNDLIVIYMQGKVFKSYSFFEFMKTPNKNLLSGCLGISWIIGNAELKDNLLVFETSEKRVIGIDIITGNKALITTSNE